MPRAHADGHVGRRARGLGGPVHVPAAAPAREGVSGEQGAAARADVQPACAHDRVQPRAHLLYSNTRTPNRTCGSTPLL